MSNRARPNARSLTPGLIALLVLVTSACSADEPNGSESDAPWSASLRQAYQEATNKDEREALADGRISRSEIAYFKAKIVRCLADIGTIAKFDGASDINYTAPKSTRETEIDRCIQENGIHILTPADSIARNPDDINENDIMAECLATGGLVPAHYSARDYANEAETGNFSFDTESDAFDQCIRDPLGAGDKTPGPQSSGQ